MSNTELTLTSRRREIDVYVYNDSTSLTLHTDPPNGQTNLTMGRAKLVQHELVMGLPLEGDTSFVLRVRLGPASAAEDAEYVGKATGRLDLSSGFLCCNEVAIALPPNRYVVDIRCFLPHSTAFAQLSKSPPKNERLGSYWRRTRPNEDFPEWLRWQCLENPHEDPGFEMEWKRSPYEEPRDGVHVDFLVSLVPAQRSSERYRVRDDGMSTWTWRRPKICPAGILSRDLQGHDDLDEDFV